MVLTANFCSFAGDVILCKTIFYIIVVLWSGCFIGWVRRLTYRQVDPRAWTDCRLYYFMFYFGRQYSSMLLVLMSIEKCFAVYFPLKSKTICTVRTAKWATGIVAVILAGCNVVYFLGVESFIIRSSGLHECILNRDFEVILNVVDSVLYLFGPFIIMFVTNFAISFKFMRAKCQHNSTESTNQALSKSATRGIAMVVTVSVTFLILTAPGALRQALLHVTQLSQYPMYDVFMYLNLYLNHSINGILYCIVGSRFRTEILTIVCRKKRPEDIATSHTVNNTSFTSCNGGGT